MVTPATGARSEPFAFDLGGGRLCLDFANTVSNRTGPEPVDHLRTYGDLVAFVRQSGIAPAAVAHDLLTRAAGHPADARAAFEEAIALREAMFRLFAALAAGHRPRPADLNTLNRLVPRAFERSRIAAVGRTFRLEAAASSEDLVSPLAPIVRSALDCLTSPDLGRIRTCAADTCGWLFLDTTRNRTRRWCDMKVCGNRAKVRRFRSR